MQQRRLRLGDILDDYCPRERRITNHAVVAMIEDDIRQTRCTTCDTEHEFKQAKLPTLRKKKESVSAAYKEVLAGVVKDANGVPAPAASGPAQPEAAQPAAVPAPAPSAPVAEPAPRAAAPVTPSPAGLPPEPDRAEGAAEAGNEDAEGTESAEVEAARVHRRLIRATLPRPENHQVVRPVPSSRCVSRRAAPASSARRARGRRVRARAARGNVNAGGARRGGSPATTRAAAPRGDAGTGRPDAHRGTGRRSRPGTARSTRSRLIGTSADE